MGGAQVILEQKRRGNRPPPAVMLACITLALAMGVAGVWFIFVRKDTGAPRPVSGEGQKLFATGAAKSAALRAAASGLQQKAVGEGYDFDADGRLLGAVADDTDLPANRTFSQVASAVPGGAAPDPAAAIRAGVRHRRAERGGAAGRGFAAAGTTEMPRERADRGLVTQSMLAYSTVGSAGWAERRPESGRAEERQGQTVDGTQESAAKGEARSEERVMNMLERLEEGMLAEAREDGGPALGRRSDGQALYPAGGSPQAFARGAVGDMRIATGPGAIVRQGKFLDCALVNELRVDLAESPVIAMVTRNFLTGDGRHVLVPAGAKLLGTAGTVQSLQQARVYIKFDRVIFPDQRSAYFPVRQVGAAAGSGAVGVPGDVDRHLFLQFGAVIMLGVLDGLAAAVQPRDALSTAGPGNLVTGQTSSAFASVVGGVLQRYANVVPTISVPPGSTMKVFFAADVQMSVYMPSSELSWVR